MSIISAFSRISHHTITIDATGSPSITPFTVPGSEDFTDGSWTIFDLALSEIGVDEFNEKVYIRIGNSIKEIITDGSIVDSLWDRVGDDIVATIDTITAPNILPPTDDESDLGSSSFRWKDLYLGSVIDFATDLEFIRNGFNFMTLESFGALSLGTEFYIKSDNGSGTFALDYLGTPGVIYLGSTDFSNTESQLILLNNYVELGSYTNGSIMTIGTPVNSMVFSDTFIKINFVDPSITNVAGFIMRGDNANTLDDCVFGTGINDSEALVTNNDVKYPAIISSQNAEMPATRFNSVILGGTDLICNHNNSVVVPAIQFGSNVAVSKMTFDLGDWNMDSDSTHDVAHTLSSTEFKTIKNLSVTVRNDADTTYYNLTSSVSFSWNSSKFFLNRDLLSVFDSVDFDSTSYNRGWLTFEYSPDNIF